MQQNIVDERSSGQEPAGNDAEFDIKTIQQKASALLIGLLWLFVPLVALTAFVHDRAWMAPAVGTLCLAAAGTLVWRMSNKVGSLAHYALAVALVGAVSMAVGVANGPWQIDFHMVYFAMLAILVVFCDWRVILVGAAATAVHHLSLNFFMPLAVFPEGGDIQRVLFHASVVIFQTVILMWLAHKLSKLFAERERLSVAAEEKRQDTAQALADRLENAVTGTLQQIETARLEMQNNSSMVRDHAASAEEQVQAASNAAAKAAEMIQTGTAAVDGLARAIGEMAGQFRETTEIAGMAAERSKQTTERVESLDKAANNISEIVELISGIAEQTNLLALNATIEAARAGEAGKGFAVVAQEVKTLASQTAGATAEISSRIEEMQSSSRDTVEAINEIGDVIRRIDDNASGVLQVIEEQNASTTAINSTMMNASDAAREITAMVASVNQSTQDTERAAALLSNAASGAADHSQTLNATISDIAKDIRAVS